jgi:hypothetical protein
VQAPVAGPEGGRLAEGDGRQQVQVHVADAPPLQTVTGEEVEGLLVACGG